MNLNLDFSFLNWGVVSSFVVKGFIFSVQLTLIAMIGGIALGTLLALMRLSGKKWLVMPAAFYVFVRDCGSKHDDGMKTSC